MIAGAGAFVFDEMGRTEEPTQRAAAYLVNSTRINKGGFVHSCGVETKQMEREVPSAFGLWGRAHSRMGGLTTIDWSLAADGAAVDGGFLDAVADGRDGRGDGGTSLQEIAVNSLAK